MADIPPAAIAAADIAADPGTTLTHATPSAVQLPEALRSIPRDAQLVVAEDHSSRSAATSWQIGAIAHAAADEIDRMTKPESPASTPLRTYDVSTDEMRPVTQEDVDTWGRCTGALGSIVEWLRKSQRPRDHQAADLVVAAGQGKMDLTDLHEALKGCPTVTVIPLAVKVAMDNCFISGNHWAGMTDGSVPYTASTGEGLEHFGHGQAFDVWVTWRGIMQLRDAWDAWMAEVNPPPANTRPSTM